MRSLHSIAVQKGVRNYPQCNTLSLRCGRQEVGMGRSEREEEEEGGRGGWNEERGAEEE